MYFKSEGAETGKADAPFVAQIFRCTRSQQTLQHEWPAPSLEAARQQAEDWLTEWGIRVGLQTDGSRSTAEARRQRIRGIADMPELPPLKARKAEQATAREEWELEGVQDTQAAGERPKERYATKAEIVRAIAAARAGGIQVAEIHIKRDGTIAILSEASQRRRRASAYDKWKQDDASRR